MTIKRINDGYIRLLKEPFLLIGLHLKHWKKRGVHPNPKEVLIINPCLTGEFMVSLHVIRHFIKKSRAKVDLLVSPPVKSLAEKIKGVRNVYTATPIHDKSSKKDCECKLNVKNYDQILVLRISPESYKMLKKLEFENIKSYSKEYFRFIYEYTKNMIRRGDPKQWKDIGFEIINEDPKSLEFEEIFNFTKEECKKIRGIKELRGKEAKVLVHINGNGWKIKRWDNKKWIEVLNKINKIGKFKFIFIGAPEEKEDYDIIKKKLDFTSHSLIGKISLKDLALVMKFSDYFMGVDSGPMNLAHILNLPCLILFGPGQRNFSSNNPRDVGIEKCNCPFCTTLFCYKRKTCFEKISVNDVFEGFKKLAGISKRNKNKK